jgi:uncharacterized protein YqjF (DUF2071 family)
MTWSKLLFAHWQVDPNILSAMLPDGLELDTCQGAAWIGIVPFLMSGVAPRYCPSLPKLSRFLELNVRTYVTYDGKPGVWFFSLDAANRLAVRAARATFNLPYMDASMSLATDASQEVHFSSKRTHRGEPAAMFDASYRPSGATIHAQPETLEYWLTARYCLYSADGQGRLYRGEISHVPWSLSPASWQVRRNTLCAPLGIELSGQPHLLFAEPIEVRAWMATRCN